MKNYFRYMASEAGRIVKGCMGFAIMSWGYSNNSYPFNLLLMGIGALVFMLAVYNILLVAPLFGYPASGHSILRKYGELNGLPGEDIYGKLAIEGYNPESGSGVRSARDERHAVRAKSTVQGGSDHGQGSMHLGAGSYKQGSIRNRGATYENEQALSGNANGNLDEQPSAANDRSSNIC